MTRPAYTLDRQASSPEAFYAAACDPRRSAVVEACAGAGKTWMLVSRILRALLDGAEPAQILAITFTRKAAGEMRERLAQWLRDFAAPVCDDAQRVVALRARGLDEAAAKAAAPALGALYERLLRDGRGVQVQTFHGWFAQLLAGAPIAALERLGLAPGLQLLEDPQPLRATLLQAFHRQVDRDPALRADYLQLVARHRRGTVQDWLDAAWHRRVEVERADAAGTLARSVPAPATDPAAAMRDPGWRASLQALASALGARGKTLSDEAAARLVDALSLDDPREAFALARLALFSTAGEPRKKIGDPPGLAEAVAALEAMLAQWRQQDAHDDHRRMARLSRVLLQCYAALKRERGLADMNDLERVGQAMLGDPELAGWVQSRLDLRVRHLLVDEFQDTSPPQWLALRAWLEGYAGAGGGRSGQQPLSVFLVGDPKQSIYRFRRAEPRVFIAAADFVVEALDGRRLACDHTRRNAPEVLASLNAVFARAAAEDGWHGFREHTTGAEAGGAVARLEPAGAEESAAESAPASPPVGGLPPGWRDALTVPRDPAQAHRSWPECQAIAALVATKVSAGIWRPGQVMVLARRRAALAQVSEALAAVGVACTEPEALSLAASPEAQDLVALLDVLSSPGHTLSLARALKCPLLGASDDDLLWLAGRQRADAATGGTDAPWWTLLVEQEDPLPGEALPRARRLLRGWADAASRLPPHDLLDRILDEGDGLARFAAALPPARRRSGLQAIDALLAASLQLDGGRYATPYGFVRAMRRDGAKIHLPTPPDAVRLLTVHGAKGLEADVVIVADSDPEARKPERATLLVDWPADAQAPASAAFVARESAPAPSLEPLLAQERLARGREELNGLYVAMTRARRTLVLARTPTLAGRADPGSWWARVRDHAVPWAVDSSVPVRIGAAEEGLSVPALPRTSPPATRAAIDATDRAAAALGRAVHRMLEWLGQPGQPAWPRERWPQAATAAAREAGLPAHGATDVLAIVGQMLGNPACARWFDGRRLAWAGNEVALDHAGQALRLDRLVHLHDDDGVSRWWVLDYKLSDQPLDDPALVAQLATYRAAVSARLPGEPVAAAFVTRRGRVVVLPD